MTANLLKRENLLGFEQDEKEKFGIVDVVLIFIIAILLLSMVVQTYWLSPVKVDGSSMMQTLQHNDWLLIDKTKTPNRGDVVVFVYSKNINYIKRIIALPGDEIYSKNGVLYIIKNGSDIAEIIEEDYAYYMEDKPVGTYKDLSMKDIPHTVVGEGQMYVLGDNRWGSRDSREIGLVEMDSIIGVVPKWAINKKEEYATYLNFIERLNNWFNNLFKRN